MGLYPGGLISGIIYSFENGWAYIRGGLKVGFYGILSETYTIKFFSINLYG